MTVPVHLTKPPFNIWRIRGLMAFAKAATIAVRDEEQVEALFDIEAGLWMMLDRAPINGPSDARGKLEAVLQDLTERDEIDDRSAGIMRQVLRFLERQVAS